MRVLVTWGTKLGGTEGIARIVGETLRNEGFDVTFAPGSQVRDVTGYDAVVVGGALYANRWHRDARRFVARHVDALRRVPVWLFSSGPLDESADRGTIPPPTQVAVLAERIGARDHATFGGRLPADARGFPAAKMAETLSGDWRNPERIRAWASELARALPHARPGTAVEHPARSLPRLFAHGVVGWAVSATILAGMLQVTSAGGAVARYTIAAPLIFAALAVHYFRRRGARDPLPTATVFTAMVALGFLPFLGHGWLWVSLAVIFLTTWGVGLVMSTLPWPKPSGTADATHRHAF